MRDGLVADLATTRAPAGFVPGGFGGAPTQRPATLGASSVQSFQPSGLKAAELPDGVRDAAEAAGFAAGFAAGAREAAALAELETSRIAAERAAQDATAGALLGRALDVLAQAAQAASSRTAPVLADSEQHLHAEALELARAVLAVELLDNEQSARAALARVLNRPRATDSVTIHLSPRDLDTVQSVGVLDLPEGVRLVADPSLAPGDALAAHADGFLDGRISLAFDRAQAALAGVSE
ncbi:FliH/SctL family protein [Cellulomonas sp. URHE0023]|uniref:FliH/SctL family protein n=1 Tax=Cellulomonas sp. URHE0023 TaxID=1380354 RepID=UPI000ADAA4C3|nr:FliH/SctL family protein [Cellulomonas sp. URHE0023]